MQYLEMNDPAELWAQLNERFNHQHTLFLPQAHSDWINLRVQDFPNFVSFNSEMHRIVALLRLCGQEINDAAMIEKTTSTFPPATLILSQQYRNMNFTRHSALMSQLLLAEKHEQLLLKISESRPVREVHTTTTQPTASAAAAPTSEIKIEAHAAEASRRPPRGSYQKTHPSNQARETRAYGKSDVHKGYHKRDENTRREPHRPRVNQFKPRNYQTRQFQGSYHKCGRKGHLAKDCRVPPYIVNIYRELQQLRTQTRQTYNFENPSSAPNSSPNNEDIENYMTLYEGCPSNPMKPS